MFKRSSLIKNTRQLNKAERPSLSQITPALLIVSEAHITLACNSLYLTVLKLYLLLQSVTAIMTAATAAEMKPNAPLKRMALLESYSS